MTLAAQDRDAVSASVVVVDYGLGNLRSVTRGLERAGADVTVSDDPAAFETADGLVLPGVGAFREGVENADPYRSTLIAAADRGQPLFGICLGMQMLLTASEEAEFAGQGEVRGLDLIPGTNVRFAEDQTVPHMGWNRLDVVRDHPLVTGVDRGSPSTPGTTDAADTPGLHGEYVYFVHSYYASPDDDSATVATTEYGVDFPAIIATDDGNVFGTQFHPEKSGAPGLRILRNFVEICAE